MKGKPVGRFKVLHAFTVVESGQPARCCYCGKTAAEAFEGEECVSRGNVILASYFESAVRSCQTCVHCELCYLRHAVTRTIHTGKGLLSTIVEEKLKTPGVSDDLYKATANACKKYEGVK